MAETVTELTVLPCGCKMGTIENDDGTKTMYYNPCNLTCENYDYFRREVKRIKKPLYIVGDDKDLEEDKILNGEVDW